MQTADYGASATRPNTARVDGDVTSRFATCSRALGLTIYDRARPADLTGLRSGVHQGPRRPSATVRRRRLRPVGSNKRNEGS